MRITAISAQRMDPNRVNIMVDGVYRFSLDITQVIDIGIKVGKEYTDEELVALENESQYGKLYGRALEYCLSRPHSAKEVRDYLYKKTRDRRNQKGGITKGVSPELTTRVFDRLVERGYIDDEKFTRFWVENRNLRKGMSRRKLEAELRQKGVENKIIEVHLEESSRSDEDELAKIVNKKRVRYPDEQKFMQYLVRLGFSYDDVKQALKAVED